MTKYCDLQKLIYGNGKEALRYYKKVTEELGPQIVAQYVEFLGGAENAAYAIPPEGIIARPDMPHEAGAYKLNRKGQIALEPITMGLCTDVSDMTGEGATLIRTVLTFSPIESGVLVGAGSKEDEFLFEDADKWNFEHICEAIYRDVEAALSRGAPNEKIGFHLPPIFK